MFWFKYRHILFVLVLTSVLSGTLAYVTSSRWQQAPANRGSTTPTGQVGGEAPGQQVRLYSMQNRYELCGHTVPSDDFTGQLQGLALEEIRRRYTTEDGWTVDESAGGAVTITRQVPGLCPADAAQRHLGVAGEYVAVYVGPVGLNGGLDRVTPIRIKDLPAEWQELIKNGELGFSGEAELLEALDSLDEYRKDAIAPAPGIPGRPIFFMFSLPGNE